MSGLEFASRQQRRPWDPIATAFALVISRRYNNSVITLSQNEERLVEALRALPPEAADTLITWATELSDLAKDGPVEWSDTWTEEDMADLQRASLANFDAREPAHSDGPSVNLRGMPRLDC